MAETSNTAPSTVETPTSTPNTAEASASPNVTPTETAPKVEASTPAKRKLKLKIDNKEVEEEFDPNDDEYLTRQFQLAKVAQKRMGEYSTLQKQVNQFIDELKKNPKKVLSNPNIGVDIKKFAASILEEEIANSQKTPEQLKSEKLEAELRDLKGNHDREKAESLQKEQERLTEQAYERYDVQMTKALESSDLPKSPYVIKKMSEYMILGLKNGVDITPEDVLPLVRSEISEDLQQMFKVMPEDVIEKIIGKDVFTRIRKKNLAKAKENPPKPLNSSIQDVGQASSKKNTDKKQTFREYFGV